jgi:hypothetical protein
MPQSRLIHETHGVLVGLEGSEGIAVAHDSVQEQGFRAITTGWRRHSPDRASLIHPPRINDTRHPSSFLDITVPAASDPQIATSRKRCVGLSAPSRWRLSRASPFERLTKDISNSRPDHTFEGLHPETNARRLHTPACLPGSPTSPPLASSA